jgi:hypothetical protein
MSKEPTDYDIVFGAMCFAIPPNEEDEAFAALTRMNETIQQLEALLEAAIVVIQRSDQVGDENWHRETIIDSLNFDVQQEQGQ